MLHSFKNSALHCVDLSRHLESLQVEPVHEGPAGVLPAAPVAGPPPPAAAKVVGADDPVDELHVAADHARYLVVQM